MNEYTSENGAISIIPSGMGGYTIRYLAESAGPEDDIFVPGHAARALREFFRAEEDERLGRWRWPALPEYVAYWHPVLQRLTVTWEPEGGSTFFKRADDLTYAGNPGRVARAYFEAHPEPKPWHDAKPGEVWELTRDGEISAYEAGVHKGNFLVFWRITGEPGYTDDISPFDFGAGRRIYPEPS